MKPVRAIIVGAGLMGRWHADAAQRSGAVIVGVVDPDTARAGALVPGVNGYAGLDEALAQSADVVHVCTPLHSHVELCEKALVAGCHVIVEKPATPTADEARMLVSVAQTANRLLVPVHQFVHQRGVAAIRQRSRDLGAIRQLEFATCSAGAEQGDRDRDTVAAEIVPHALSLARNLLGVNVATLSWQLVRSAPGEWRFSAAAPSGSAINGMISLSGRPTFATCRVLADHGSATADLFHGFAVFEQGHASRRYKIVRPLLLGMRGAGIATANLVRRAISGESAYPGLRSLCAATYSAIQDAGAPPFGADEIVDVARARDRLVALAAG